MAGYVQPGFTLILLFLITNALPGAALTEPEIESVIALPSEGNTGRSTVCNEKYESVSCPVSCFRPDPVCGVDGNTYWCGCADAQCAGVEVAKIGFCEVGNGGSGLLSGQALLLVHIVWLILLGFIVFIGVP